jgi:hypothetical protein
MIAGSFALFLNPLGFVFKSVGRDSLISLLE